jgi:diguanylate cyclase (GGDEF)-like protein
MITGSGNESVAVEAMKMGASDYVVKDIDGGYIDLLPTVVEKVLQKQLLLNERQEALDALQRHNHDLALLHRASQMVTATLDFDQVMNQLLRVAAEIVNGEGGSVWLWESGGSTRLMCQALLHQSKIQTPVDLHLSTGDGIAGWVAKHGESALINDVNDDSRFSRKIGAILGITVQNIIAVPIQVRDETKGALVVSNKNHGLFDENDLFLIQTLASTAAIAIENARLFAEVQRLSITDELTGVYSRRHFFTIAEQELQRASRYEHNFAVIMLDIDHFKQINDEHGHLVGDKVLKRLAVDLGKTVRGIDFICRYGGEEFIILLPESNLNTAIRTAERLREYVEDNPFVMGSETFKLTISAGVANYSKESPDIESLLMQADKALYKAKSTGRNKVVSA